MEILKQHPYLTAPLVFVAWLFVLWLLKKIIFRKLRRVAFKTSTIWDDVFVDSLSLPVDLLIITSGFAFIENLLPLPARADHFTTIAFQSSLVFCIVLFLDRFILGLIKRQAAKKGLLAASQGITKGLIRGFIIGVGVLVFMDILGISITPILASLGITSLAVALALQDTLSNLFAGIYLTIDKPVKVGDFIRLDSGYEGYVRDIGWRMTYLQETSDNLVMIPNSKLITGVLRNYHLPKKDLAVLVAFSVTYGSDLQKVEKITMEVAEQVTKEFYKTKPSAQPSVRFEHFGDSGISATAVLRAHEFMDNYTLKHLFIINLHQRFSKENIEFSFPTRTLDIPKSSLELLKKV